MIASTPEGSRAAELFTDRATAAARAIWPVRPADLEGLLATLTPAQASWVRGHGFKAAARRHLAIPAADGSIAGVLLGLGDGPDRPGAEPASALLGLLPPVLPPGDYAIATALDDPGLAAVAWGLGGYRFRRYKSANGEPLPRLVLPPAADAALVCATVDAVSFGRDLINTPSNDMGPAELEAAARSIAGRHGAAVTVITGDELIAQNFPLIHAVGRASPRAPRLIDMVAGPPDAPKVTIVGKGICFDTGGLDIKPANAMLLMKKDMGGAAAGLALAQMVLATRLRVRLRLLIAAAENSISGNAFRPGDVIASRSGKTVEIGNTDAEGRLVLSDALSLADEERPELILSFATLTGAARVAVGPEIAPYYTDGEEFAGTLDRAAIEVADPVWRMPLAPAYESWLDSPVADLNNVAEGGFAGSVVAALFLKRFVRNARTFAHFDIYGWRSAAKALGPKGGETNAVRAVYATLHRMYGRT